MSNDFLNNNNPKTWLEKELNESLSETKIFLKNQHELVITKSDKGNITVTIRKDVYITKMLHIPNNEDSFQLIPNNPTKILQKGTFKILEIMRTQKCLSDNTKDVILIQ